MDIEDEEELTDDSAKADIIFRISELTGLAQRRQNLFTEAARLEVLFRRNLTVLLEKYGDNLSWLSKIIATDEVSPLRRIYLEEVFGHQVTDYEDLRLANAVRRCLDREVNKRNSLLYGGRDRHWTSLYDLTTLGPTRKFRGWGKKCFEYANKKLAPYGIELEW